MVWARRNVAALLGGRLKLVFRFPTRGELGCPFIEWGNEARFGDGGDGGGGSGGGRGDELSGGGDRGDVEGGVDGRWRVATLITAGDVESARLDGTVHGSRYHSGTRRKRLHRVRLRAGVRMLRMLSIGRQPVSVTGTRRGFSFQEADSTRGACSPACGGGSGVGERERVEGGAGRGRGGQLSGKLRAATFYEDKRSCAPTVGRVQAPSRPEQRGGRVLRGSPPPPSPPLLPQQAAQCVVSVAFLAGSLRPTPPTSSY
eukprot:scaffold137231_cov30-Tisochrysis_lutea.AAC.1